MIPLEYATIQSSEELKELDTLRYTIEIQLHKAYEECCMCMSYKLAASKSEIQATWLTALTRAVLPLRVLIRELNATGRLDNLLANAEAVQQDWKSKVSFFRPGRLIDEYEVIKPTPERSNSIPNPLNVATTPNIFAGARRDTLTETGVVMPPDLQEQDALQTIIDRRFSRTSSAGTNSSLSGINLTNVLSQTTSTEGEKVSAVYEWNFEDNNQADTITRETESAERKRSVGQDAENWEQGKDEENDDADSDVISIAQLAPAHHQLDDSSPEQFSQERRISTRKSEHNRSSQFPGFSSNLPLSRSQADEHHLSPAQTKKTALSKRQTIHSYRNPNWKHNGRSSGILRQSRFLPYAPTSLLSQDVHSTPQSTKPARLFVDASNSQWLERLQEERAPVHTTFEDELREKLRQRRARVDAVQHL